MSLMSVLIYSIISSSQYVLENYHSISRFESDQRQILEDHLFSIHLNLINLSCFPCDRAFSHLDKLLSHLQDHHNNLPLDKVSRGIEKTVTKSEEESSEGFIFVCQKCKQPFCTKEELKGHQKLAHLVLQCALCQFKTNSEADLVHHVNDQHADRTIDEVITDLKCPFSCAFTGVTPMAFSIHLKAMHRLDLKEKCCFCEETGTHILRHIDTIHLDIRKYPCPKCNHRFTCKRDLDNHNKVHEKNLEVIVN